MSGRVLLVEDDDGVRGALTRGLTRSGFAVHGVGTAAEALAAPAYDVALVDLGLPDRCGVELCKELNERAPTRPIVVVTGRDSELDLVDALGAGADDYVTKPFSLQVLVARMRRHVERSTVALEVGPLMIDRPGRRAVLCGSPLELTPREFDLLTELAAHAGEAVTTSHLIKSVWDAHWSKSTHTLAVHVSALRSKLRAVAGAAAPRIATVAGVGYRLEPLPSNR